MSKLDMPRLDDVPELNPVAKGNPQSDAKPSPQRDDLLDCLVLLTELSQSPRSPEALKSGLPHGNQPLTKNLFLRAAESAGFFARWEKRAIKNISAQVMPVVLSLKDNRHCILLQYGGGKARVLYPETGDGEVVLTQRELDSIYIGECCFCRQRRKSDNRADQIIPVETSGHWFWSMVWRFKSVYIQVIMATVLVNLFALAGSMFVLNVYDRVVPNNALETLWVLAIGVMIIYGFDFLLKLIRARLLDQAAKKVDLLLSSQVFAHVMGMKLINRPASTGVMANQMRDLDSLREFMTSATTTVLSDLPFAFFFIWIISLIGGPIAWIPLTAMGVMLAIGLIAQIPQSRLMSRFMNESAVRHGILIESIEGINSLRTMRAEGWMQKRWEESVAYAGESMATVRQLTSFVTTTYQLIVQLVTVAIVVLGVYLIIEGNLTLGGLIACSILSGRVAAPITQIGNLFVRYQQAKLSYSSLNAIMQADTERSRGKHYLNRPVLQGNIHFKDVCFQYEQDTGFVLKDFNLRVRQGEKIGIIGRVGTGKTTALALIAGFYSANSGQVLMDGTEVNQIDPADLRRNLIYIEQDSPLFHGTLRQNLLISSPQLDDERLLSIISMVGLNSLIAQHPLGIDLPVGEQGRGLSGGQRQAVAVARALLDGGNVVLFDEPTGSMDFNTERLFVSAMEQELKDKTLLLITHKPALLKLVNRLIVIEQGKVMIDGPKNKVLEALSKGIDTGAEVNSHV